MAEFQEIINYSLFTMAGTPITVATLFGAAIVALFAFIVARLVERATEKFLNARGIKDQGSVGATARLVYYLVLGGGLATAIYTLGINLTSLFAAGAFLAIAFGFAMQNITQNFVSGLILLIERTIKPGDIIEV